MNDQQLAVLAVVLWTLYVDNAAHALRMWLHERTYRSLRNAYIGLMLFVGLTLIAAAAVNHAFPDAIPTLLLDALRPVLYGMLLVGGVVLAWTWRAEE